MKVRFAVATAIFRNAGARHALHKARRDDHFQLVPHMPRRALHDRGQIVHRHRIAEAVEDDE